MELIGKGLFSKVYRLNDEKVLIKSKDWAKECLALFIDNECFPVIEKVDCDTYECKYYSKVTSLKDSLSPEHYELYKELRALEVSISNTHDLYSKWREQFETVSNEEYREALIEAIDEMINYGSQIRFEISPRNVAVDNGRLILLDVFYFEEQAKEYRNKTKKVYAY